MKIIWREKAIEDLNAIYTYLAPINKRAATFLYNQILDEVEILLKFPTIAPIQSLKKKLEFPLRGLLIKNKIHKVMYFVDGRIIYITQIWDCRRHPDKLE